MTASAVADIRSTYGPIFIGLFVNSVLIGMIIMQTWNFFWLYRHRDPQSLKVFVAILVSLDCLHTILCFYAVYWYLILNFGNTLQFDRWSTNSQAAIAAVVSFMVHLLYVRRLYILSKRVILPLVTAGAASIGFVSGFTQAIRLFVTKGYTPFSSLTWLTILGLGSVLTTDVLIALSLCWSLYHSRTGFPRTDSVLMTLMTFCISSGLLTCLIASATIVSYVVMPTPMISQALYWLMVKCHVNSLLAMLNSRNSILERSAALHPENTFYMGSFGTTPQKGTNHEPTSRPTAISVSMHQTIASDFAPGKHDSNVGPKVLNVEKLDPAL